MSDLKILIFPDPKLRKVAKKIRKFDKSLEMLAQKMLQTMYEAEGIGPVSYTHLTLPTNREV